MTIGERIEWPFKMVCIGLVRAYQIVFSPHMPNCCRFEPSCSRYAMEALQRKRLPVALWLILYRLARCNPFCKGGHDPVN